MTFTTEYKKKGLMDSLREEQERAAQEEKDRYDQAQESKACKEPDPPPVEKYSYERKTMSPLGFAEHVLKDHGLLYNHHGHEFLDHQPATPARKVEHASAVLVRMKLAPIALGKRP